MIHTGDCVEVMAAMEPESIDAIVTDPPYGLEFMGKEWDSLNVATRTRGGKVGRAGYKDGTRSPVEYGFGRTRTTMVCDNCGKRDKFQNEHSCVGPTWTRVLLSPDGTYPTAMQEWHQRWATAAYRVAKPSAYLLAFGGTRTVHRLTCALEDAGWIIRDLLVWGYASGFPKSKASLKPAWEPIVLARKPGPLRELAIDACRIPLPADDPTREWGEKYGGGRLNQQGEPYKTGMFGEGVGQVTGTVHEAGRWPANIVLSDPIFDGGWEGVVGGGEAGGGFGIAGNRGTFSRQRQVEHGYRPDGPMYANEAEYRGETVGYGDSGTYSRFYSIPITMGACWYCGVAIADGSSRDGETTVTPSGTAPESASSLPSSSNSDPALSAATRSDGAGASTVLRPVAMWPDEDDGSSKGQPTTSASGTASSSAATESTPPTPRSSEPGTSPASGRRKVPAKSKAAASPETGTTTTTHGRPMCATCADLITSGSIEAADYPRFLIIPKADRADREPVLGGLPVSVVNITEGHGLGPVNTSKGGDGIRENRPRANVHPTVKPTDLMRHLVRLVTPSGGTVLDPFGGSGTTAIACELEGFPWILIEREAEYVRIAEARLNGTQRGLGLDVGAPTPPPPKAKVPTWPDNQRPYSANAIYGQFKPDDEPEPVA